MWNWLRLHRIQLVFALTSGVLLTLAFPNFDQGWLAWIALVPLLLALREAQWQTGFWLGFTAGLVHHLGLIYWTAYTMHTYGGLPWLHSVIILFVFCAFLALFTALYAAGLSYAKAGPVLTQILSPLMWTAFEYVRTCLFTGFPWELLGYSQYDHLWTIQSADIFGVYGVSALIVWFNTVLTLLVLHWLEKPWQNHGIPRNSAVPSAVALVMSLVGIIGYGVIRIGAVGQAVSKAPKADVAVIQGNIDQASKWDTRFQMMTTVKYNKLSRSVISTDPLDLVIWPETATPFFFMHNKILSDIIIENIRSGRAYYIIGSPAFADPEDQSVYNNSAFLMTPQGTPAGRYDKVHLVPFGEYVPIKRWLPFIDKLVAQVGDFKRGKSGNTLQWNDYRIGMQICYEIIFPALSRHMVQNGAHLLVNITNDAWFGRTGAPYQHFSMAVMRAVENRRFLARSANTGISGFIDPCGRVMESTHLNTEATARQTVALLSMRSLYSRWGDWPLAVLAFGIPIAVFSRRVLRRHYATP